jgi:hypothetical protein
MVWTLIIVLLLAINPVPSAENPSSRARFLFLLSSLLALPKGRCALHGALLSPGRDRVNPAVSALLLLAANVAASKAPVVALLQSCIFFGYYFTSLLLIPPSPHLLFMLLLAPPLQGAALWYRRAASANRSAALCGFCVCRRCVPCGR